MKTLDEVIDYLEGKQACGEWPGIGDALHYLKEYHRLQTAYIKAMADIEDNPPLSWDELKQMVGKPIWVELGLLQPRWYLIKEFHGEQMILINDLSGCVPLYEDSIYTGGCKVYRKERTE